MYVHYVASNSTKDVWLIVEVYLFVANIVL